MSSGFITESEIEAKRQVRQAEWDKVRKEDDPVVAPDEPAPDNRSLFDRLQEQKVRKQEEFEEAHKLKNLVKGLDDDEADFLELVDKTKMDLEKQKKLEEVKELNEFRSKMAEIREQELSKHIRQELGLEKNNQKKPKLFDDHLPSIGAGKTSQAKLLAGIVKRKSTPSESNGDASKKPKFDEQVKPTVGPSTTTSSVISSTSEPAVDSNYVVHSIPYKGSLVCVGVLPGMGTYSDSSNSDNDSSDSEEGADNVLRDLCGRPILPPDEPVASKKKK